MNGRRRETNSAWIRVSIGFALLAFTAVASQSMLASALPLIAADFDSVGESTWVLSAYLVSFAAVLPAYGSLLDSFDPKLVALVSVGLFMLGTITGALAPSTEGLIAARVVQGLGGAGMTVASQTGMTTAMFHHNVRYMGALGGILAVATLSGPALGSLVVEISGWRSIFWVSLAAVVVGTALSLLGQRPAMRRTHDKVDIAGIAIVSFVTCIVIGALALPLGEDSVIPLVAVGIVLIACLLALSVVEKSAKSPVFPLSIFRNRNFLLVTVSSLLMGVATFGFIAYVPTFLQMARAEGVVEAGVLSLPLVVGALVSSNVAGHLAAKYHLFKQSAAVGAVAVAAGLYLGATLTIDSPDWTVLLSMFLVGLGVGAGNQLLTVVVQRSLPAALIGRATAANSYFRYLGLAIGAALAGGVFSFRLSSALAAIGVSDLPTPEQLQLLPPHDQVAIIGAYDQALMPLFAFLAPLALIRAVLLMLIRTPEAQKPRAPIH